MRINSFVTIRRQLERCWSPPTPLSVSNSSTRSFLSRYGLSSISSQTGRWLCRLSFTSALLLSSQRGMHSDKQVSCPPQVTTALVDSHFSLTGTVQNAMRIDALRFQVKHLPPMKGSAKALLLVALLGPYYSSRWH